MANETGITKSVDAPNPASSTPDAVAQAPVRKFRVVHGAVSGIGLDKKRKPVDKDFYEGSTVTEADLDGFHEYYLDEGAIEEVH